MFQFGGMQFCKCDDFQEVCEKLLFVNSINRNGGKSVCADAFPLKSPTYLVSYVGIVQTTSDVKPHQPSNHGTSRQPMTMATMAPIGWIPFIQYKEPRTDALLYIRTAGFS